MMTANLFIDNSEVGQVQFKIIDESMGVIGGPLVCNAAYANFRNEIQEKSELKGIANSDDFTFSVWLDNKIKLAPEGGIGVTDLKDFEGVYVEVGGLSEEILVLFK